jgi:hypothetical protein
MYRLWLERRQNLKDLIMQAVQEKSFTEKPEAVFKG